MRRFFRARQFVILLLLWPALLSAAPCWKTIFEWNEKDFSKRYKLLILPFENTTQLPADEWMSFLFPTVLQDYISLSPSTAPYIAVSAPTPSFFNTARALEIAKAVEADFVIIGQFSRQGAALQISTRLLSARAGSEVGRVGGQVEFPGTRSMNDVLIELADRASRTFKKLKLTKKRMLPYRNETISAGALRSFVLGTVALKKGTAQGVQEAIHQFEESIRNDYNYVPAYLGHALALARKGFLDNSRGLPYRESFARARMELEKARALKPYMTERKAREIEIYLEAETHYRLADGYAQQGEVKKAIDQVAKAIDLLAGDLSSRQRLVAYLTERRKNSQVREQQKMIDLLNQCEEGE